MITSNSHHTEVSLCHCAASVIIAIMLFGAYQVSAADVKSAEVPNSTGYNTLPSFGGPSSTGETLKDNNAEAQYRFTGLRSYFSPYYSWTDKIHKTSGLAFSFDYSMLYQAANATLGEEDTAGGGIFRFYGTWTLLNKDTGNPGSIVYKIENRHDLGTEVVPQTLGFEVGYTGSPGAQFGDTGWILSNLHWLQKTYKGRLNFSLGIVDPTDYLNFYALVDPLTSFSNLAFLTGATIPAPSQGLGAVVGWAPLEQMYMIGGIYDTNGDPSEPENSIDLFFNDNEYFKQVEIGWVSSFDRKLLDNVHLTFWQADERDEAGVEDGWGAAFSATKFLNDKWLPFLRLGYAEDGGAMWERSASTGVGYYFANTKDVLGVGVNWGKTPEGNEQYTTEVFYRLQVTQELAITPDVQLIIDPAQNPDEDQLWIIGLRARLTL